MRIPRKTLSISILGLILLLYTTSVFAQPFNIINLGDGDNDIRLITKETLEENDIDISDITNNTAKFYEDISDLKFDTVKTDDYPNMDVMSMSIDTVGEKQVLRVTYTTEIKDKFDKVDDVKFIFYTNKTESPTRITMDYNTKKYYLNGDEVGEIEFARLEAPQDQESQPYSDIKMEFDNDTFPEAIERDFGSLVIVYLVNDDGDLIFDVMIDDPFNPLPIIIVIIVVVIVAIMLLALAGRRNRN